jgi:hypothetical protein
MGKHTGKNIPKGGKRRAHANAASRRSGKTDIEKRKVVTQKTPNVSGAKPPKRIDNVPFSKNKKPINLKNVRKAMNKGGFPDLSGDGKVTQKDILMGRGVIKKAGGGSAMPGMKKRVMAKKGKSIQKKRVKKKMKRTMKRGGGMAMANRPMRRGGGMMKKNMM